MGNQPDKIRVSAGEDLLAFIPHMVGYWPNRSIVCIGMSGKRLRATMRLDLPAEDYSEVHRFAEIAASQLSSDPDADGCLIAIFGNEDWIAPKQIPHAQTYSALRMALAEVGLPVRDAWFVGPDHWRSLECTDAGCCSWPGKDNSAIRESFVNTEFIYRGSLVRESPAEQIQELIAVEDEAFAASVLAAGEEYREPLAQRGLGEEQMAVTLGAWEHSLTRWPTTPDASMTAFLLASLADTTIRDIVMVALATTPNHAFTGAMALRLVEEDEGELHVPHAWHGGNQAASCSVHVESYADTTYLYACRDFGNILIGEISDGDGRIKGPDWQRLEKAQLLLQFLCRTTRGADKAPVLCILGWIQWCKGRGTWAGTYFQQCQAFQPGYRLASMLDQLLAIGHIASCAKDERTAWHGSSNESSEEKAA